MPGGSAGLTAGLQDVIVNVKCYYCHFLMYIFREFLNMPSTKDNKNAMDKFYATEMTTVRLP